MNNLKEILKTLSKDKKLSSICADTEDQNSFSVGFVEWVGKEIILIKSYTPDGEYDGFKIRKISDIIVIENDGKYEFDILDKIEVVEKYRKQASSSVFEPLDTIFDVIQKLMKDKVLVTLFYGSPEYKYQGIIENINSNFLTLNSFDEYKQVNGNSYLICENISAIDFGEPVNKR